VLKIESKYKGKTKMENGMISVVIPVHNAEKHLRTCLQSVINQTYTNLEIILVDDGSTDGSGAICIEYQKKDARVHYIYQENEGPAAARNKGLSQMNGDYVAFVDSDDELCVDAYHTMLDKMLQYDTDMVVCSWREKNMVTDYISDIKPEKDIVISAKELTDIVAMSNTQFGGGYPWNRLIKVTNQELPLFDSTLHVYEDKVWIMELLKQIHSTVWIEDIGYIYYIRDTGISHDPKRRFMRCDNQILAMKKIETLLIESHSSIIENYQKNFCRKTVDIMWLGLSKKCLEMMPNVVAIYKEKLEMLLKMRKSEGMDYFVKLLFLRLSVRKL
jgi:glycosyltransferase involved in cell wall biosynthesis